MSTENVIGIDVGGTKIEAATYERPAFTQVKKKRIDTRADQGFEVVFQDILELITELRDDSTTAVGIGVPGLVRRSEGALLTMPNIGGGEEFPLRERLESATGLRCSVDNDGNCFTLAEAVYGAGKNHRVVTGVTLGTGVGGGIVIDGRIFHGGRGFAGEIGHMLLLPGQPPFRTDDKRGDVEQFFSGTAMGKRCEEAKSPDDYLQGHVCEFMHKSIYKEVAWMCTNLIHLIDPSVIVFGGSAGHAMRPHIDGIREELSKWTLPGMPLPELAIATLANSPTLGAALLADDDGL